MAADGLAMQGARASAVMVLTHSSQYRQPRFWSCDELLFHCFDATVQIYCTIISVSHAFVPPQTHTVECRYNAVQFRTRECVHHRSDRGRILIRACARKRHPIARPCPHGRAMSCLMCLSLRKLTALYWPYVRGNHGSLVDFSNKEPVMMFTWKGLKRCVTGLNKLLNKQSNCWSF